MSVVPIEKAAPQNAEAEASVLGAVLLVPRFLGALLTEVRLAPEHFYLDKHCELYRVLVSMHDQGKEIDVVTVCAEIEQRGLTEKLSKHYVSELAATVAVAGNALHYARIVVEEAEWRLRKQAGQTILAAVGSRDREAIAEAEELLSRDLVHSGSDYAPDALQDVAWRLVDQGGAESFPWPFERLNRKTAGGMRRGEFILVGGHTSHGKSQFLDQTLEAVQKRGLRVNLYMNEMTLDERVARLVNRRTGIPYSKVIQGKLSEDQKADVARDLARGFAFGITLVAGWSADDIAHHIRRHRWDVCALDILHRLDYEDERELSRISSTLATAAQQAECALICAVHLNEKRVQSIIRPRPTLGDIRGSGALKNDADTVLFVYLEQDSETGEPLADGSIYLMKVRNGECGGMRVRFNAGRLRFEVRS